MDTAVVLVSGGLNSCVAAGIASKEYKIALLHVNCGQRTSEREQSCFQTIARSFQDSDQVIATLPHMATVGGGARVNRRLAIDDAATLSDRPCSAYTPGLIPTLLGLAYHYADAVGAKRIFVGSSENDNTSGPRTSVLFPDHKREVYHLFSHIMEVTAKSQNRIVLDTPLISMTRAEVVRLGLHIGVPFDLTWSCERNTDKPCGTCLGCVSRARGFLDAGVVDPIMIHQEPPSSRFTAT